MGEVDLLDDLTGVASSDGNGGCSPFTDAVECQDYGLTERRREKGARSMAVVVFREENR